MKLQLDSTVSYVTGKPGVATTAADRANPSPYNTYVHPGCRPGRSATRGRPRSQAALQPDATGTWLYFVTVNPTTGETRFATTDAEARANTALFNAWCAAHSGGLPGHGMSDTSGDRAGRPRERRAAVMGSPIAHSLSPALHRAAYASLGLASWRYDAFEVDAAGLPAPWTARARPGSGVSLTMPLKHAVLPLLDEVSRPRARRRRGQHRDLHRARAATGDNTDVHGIVAALRAAGVRSAERPSCWAVEPPAASALAALRELGEPAPTVVVRSPDRAAAVTGAGRAARACGPGWWPGTGPGTSCPRRTVVVSTVAAGRGRRPAGRARAGRGRAARRRLPALADRAGCGLGGRAGAWPCPGWRCWCTRPGPRSGPGPAALPTSRSCARPGERESRHGPVNRLRTVTRAELVKPGG